MPRPDLTPARSVRALAAVLTAVALSAGASACGVIGGGVDAADVSKRLQEETELQEVPAESRKKYADCLAEVAVKHGNKDDVEAYVAGKKQADDIRGMDSKAAEDAADKCVATAKE